MAKTKKKAAPKRPKVDYSDPESVKKAMAKVLDINVDDLEISDSHYTDFTGNVCYKLESGRQEWHVAEDEDTAHKIAVAIVLQDLEEDPSIFEQNFIESHIDKNHLRNELMSDVESSEYDRLNEEAQQNPIQFCKDYDIDIPEPTFEEMKKYASAMGSDEDEEKEIMAKLKEGNAEDKWTEMGEEPEVPDSAIQEAAEERAKELLKDPIAYLEEFETREDAIKRAIEIGGINEKDAAEEAVSTDGAGHFLGHYDGNLNDGPDGLVYWRTN